MLVVVGTQLDHAPRFWDKTSEWYLPQVKAMMVSYADFHKSRSKRKAAMERGLREYLGVDQNMLIYLDNGSFAFWRRGVGRPIDEYIEFIAEARPDWYPVPTDYIPHPQLSSSEQQVLFEKTMHINLEYAPLGYVPVIHAGDWLPNYLEAFGRHSLLTPRGLALGGLVPRLLSSKGSSSRESVVDAIKRARECLPSQLHIFGIGGLTTLHLAAALGVDSIDSSGWRNRAARGLVLLPGRGERSVVPLGNWRGVEVSAEEIEMLETCGCPACQRYGLAGLRASNAKGNRVGRGSGSRGFNNRAVHNLWTLLREAQEIEAKLQDGTYKEWYPEHVAGSIVLKLIKYATDHSSLTFQKT